MSGAFAIDAELAPLWDLTMGDGQTLSGRLAANGTIAGTLADPRLVGTASLTGGRFADSSTGLKLQGVSLEATLRNNAIDVSSFEGRDAARGSVTGSGRIGLERDAVSDLQLVLKDFRLIDNDIGQAAASGQRQRQPRGGRQGQAGRRPDHRPRPDCARTRQLRRAWCRWRWWRSIGTSTPTRFPTRRPPAQRRST